MEQDLFYTEPVEEELEEEVSADDRTAKYLLFCSDDLLFGVTADYVVEIITNHTITPLPLVPGYIRGIINLRGQIIPIVDVHMLLGQPSSGDNCIIILNINDNMVGILVDTVQRMIDVEKDTLLPAPRQDIQHLVSGMCSLPDGQTMLVFDCLRLLEQA